MMMVWNDRQGRFSPLKSATLAAAVLPAVLIAYWFFTGALQPLSVKGAILLTGTWAVRFLVIALALTPVQRVFNYSKIVLVRRMVGVTAFAYALTHFTLFVINSKFDLGFVATEIFKRFYLTIGFVTLLGLGALAATSFDAAVRKLGASWKKLHRIVYGLAGLGLFHYFLQSKVDVSAATLMAGLFMLAMCIRVMIAQRIALTMWNLLGAAFLASALTAGVEFAWYGLATGVNPKAVFLANFMISFGLRPAVIVGLVGIAVGALAAAAQFAKTRRLRIATAQPSA
jgi:methionine sulfoxide reductase heme-binding subunit